MPRGNMVLTQIKTNADVPETGSLKGEIFLEV
jgi:hypothetical protein